MRQSHYFCLATLVWQSTDRQKSKRPIISVGFNEIHCLRITPNIIFVMAQECAENLTL